MNNTTCCNGNCEQGRACPLNTANGGAHIDTLAQRTDAALSAAEFGEMLPGLAVAAWIVVFLVVVGWLV